MCMCHVLCAAMWSPLIVTLLIPYITSTQWMPDSVSLYATKLPDDVTAFHALFLDFMMTSSLSMCWQHCATKPNCRYVIFGEELDADDVMYMNGDNYLCALFAYSCPVIDVPVFTNTTNQAIYFINSRHVHVRHHCYRFHLRNKV